METPDMQYGHVPGIDKPISRLVQGTVMLRSEQLDESFALLDGVFEAGCTCFDTGHVYGGGDCTRTLGRWIRDRGVGDKVVVIGKGAHPNADRKRVTPFDIAADLHDTLARLGSDCVDLYVLHRDDPDVPVGPIVEALNEHKAAGRIGAFGGSNWTHRRIAEANEYAEAHGLTPFAVSSPNFSLAVQIKEPWGGCISISGDADALAYYRESQMPLFTWSSLAGGFFSGRLTRENAGQPRDDYFDQLCVETYCSEENFRRLDRVGQLARQKGLSIPQIATAYVMGAGLNLFALVGCRTASEFAANTQAMTTPLTPPEIAWLELRADTRS